ncbi:MAG: ABC-F family ATP-binding cassette domain-containing protein [Bacteroidales bacterium]
MISYLQVENLTKSFGDKILFQDITFGIFEGDKIGLIAKNGAGKTTLLKILGLDEQFDSGKITFANSLKIGYLKQIPEFDPNQTVIGACLNNNDEITTAIRNYEIALDNNDTAAIAEYSSKLDHLDGWDYERRVKQILTNLKITDFAQPISQLSGGQVKRIALAQIIVNEPDMLLLDEPTNHLDIEIIEWLEKFLNKSRITLLMITHDRYFLDSVCNKIIELDSNEIYTYKGNYNYYLTKRQERIEAETAETAKARNLLKTELDWMRRQPQARGTKAKYRIDAFYDLEKRAANKRDNSTLDINIKSSYIGSKIFEAKNISKSYGEKVILKDFNYTFSRKEKLGIIGENGVGKSTFIKLLLGTATPDSGYFDIGETVKFGYYSQEGLEFDEGKKVIDIVKDVAEVITFDEKTSYTASQFLQLFLFPAADQQKFVSKLSGGEKRRLYLATVLMRNPNFLILDEPTNDLDIMTLKVLQEYLERFTGCLIVISHDRYFMDNTVDHIFALEGAGAIKDFPGNYTDYKQWRTQQAEAEAAQKTTTTAPKATTSYKDNSNKPTKLTFNEKREFERLTTEIAELEQEKTILETLFNSGTEIPDIAEKSIRHAQITDELDEKEMRWLELSEKA